MDNNQTPEDSSMAHTVVSMSSLFLLYGNNLCSVAIKQKVTEVNHESPKGLLLLYQEGSNNPMQTALHVGRVSAAKNYCYV